MLTLLSVSYFQVSKLMRHRRETMLNVALVSGTCYVRPLLSMPSK